MNPNTIVRYFDLQSARRSLKALPQSADGGGPPAPVLPQYIALVLGIIVEPGLHAYLKGSGWIFPDNTLALIAFGLVMGIILFPGVYRGAFDPGKPIFVQLCAIFTIGIGWQSMFKAASQVVGVS